MVLKQISEFLRGKISQGTTDFTEIEEEPLGIAEFPAAVLFVDISGALASTVAIPDLTSRFYCIE
jgi:hypothetical protein